MMSFVSTIIAGLEVYRGGFALVSSFAFFFIFLWSPPFAREFIFSLIFNLPLLLWKIFFSICFYLLLSLQEVVSSFITTTSFASGGRWWALLLLLPREGTSLRLHYSDLDSPL